MNMGEIKELSLEDVAGKDLVFAEEYDAVVQECNELRAQLDEAEKAADDFKHCAQRLADQLCEARAELARLDAGWEAANLATMIQSDRASQAEYERDDLRAAVENNNSLVRMNMNGKDHWVEMFLIPLPPSAAPAAFVEANRDYIVTAAPAASEPNGETQGEILNGLAESDPETISPVCGDAGGRNSVASGCGDLIDPSLLDPHHPDFDDCPHGPGCGHPEPAASEPNRSHATTAAKDLSAEAGAGPKPLPCPFCGDTDVIVSQGITFRWKLMMCNTCAARGPEVRIQTTGEGHTEDWERKGNAVARAAWNRRAGIQQLDALPEPVTAHNEVTEIPSGKCELCGEQMPRGEEMFRFHGYSGPCPSLTVE